MDNFEAFRTGTFVFYTPAVMSNYRHTDPKAFDIPAENHEAFRIGLELGSNHYMIHTADGTYDYERDIANYNRTAEKADELMGAETVNKVEAWNGGKNRFVARDPKTGEELSLFKAEG